MSNLLVFISVWWIVLYMVLPFGNTPPQKIVTGHDTSAPAKPRMAVKLLATTIIAAIISYIIIHFIETGFFSRIFSNF